MGFNSLTFIGFFAAVLLVFLLTQKKFKAPLLLVASYVFYWPISPSMVLLLFLLTFVSYGLALLIDRSKGRHREITLYISLFITLGTLFYFKYFNFISENLNQFFHLPAIFRYQIQLEVVGLSFIVFQITSYLVDVFYRSVQTEKNFFDYALFVAFFPKLLQGPLERAQNLLPQIQNLDTPNFENLKSGLMLVLWGLFLKTVVADRIGAMYVDSIYSDLNTAETFGTLLAIFFYTAQIYFDFSGYTNIAIGVSLCFGVNLSKNFNSPMLAKSCTDFWRRWHITLSNWLRDYLFLPLQMEFRALGVHGAVIATLITFLIAGLWHGANWGFIAFGLMHGVWLSIEIYSNHILKKHRRIKVLIASPFMQHVKLAITYTLVSITFVFFRSPEIDTAQLVLGAFFRASSELLNWHPETPQIIYSAFLGDYKNPYQQLRLFNFLVLITAFFVIGTIHIYSKRCSFDRFPKINQWLCAEALLISIVLLGVNHGSHFAYFKF